MVYRAIGLMSGSSLDGLDIAFVEFLENGGKWSYEILQADCYPYSDDWKKRLQAAITLNALDYQLLHVEYGHFLGEQVNRFIEANELQYKIALIASHGHTSFHIPAKKMTAQLGDGAAIAAETGLPVVSDLRAMDIALGGQGAPIVPIGEKLLMKEYSYFLNIGGIANVSLAEPETGQAVAFDICPANRVLNMLANEKGKEYDDAGNIAATGNINEGVLKKLNALDYYRQSPPKSLANDFGVSTIFPIIKEATDNIADALRTYTEHIAVQVHAAIADSLHNSGNMALQPAKMLVTGGGAFNTFLIKRLTDLLDQLNIEVIVPDDKLVNYKEALIMALAGVLRWREETTVLSSVTGAVRDSVGGAMWMGQGQ